MRYSSKLLALVLVVISSFVFLFTPRPSEQAQARSMNAAQINALFQTSNGTQCHNDRTFCRADVSRCQSNERERQKWRSQCLAAQRSRYDECVSSKAPRRGHYGRKVEGLDPRCAHLVKFEETKCQVEPQICPRINQCDQQYRQCVNDYALAVAQEGRDLRSVQDASRPVYREPAPQITRETSRSASSNSAKGKVNLERAAASMARTQAKQAKREQIRDEGLRYAQTGRLAGLERLLDEGMIPGFSNQDGNTLLHAAVNPYGNVAEGNIAVVERLIELGVDADRRNRSSETPLALALDRRIKDRNYHRSDNSSKTSPFKNKVLNALVDASRIIPRTGGEGGLTLLHVAALDYDALLIQKLIKRKFPSDVKDDRGRTAYQIARAKSDALAALFPAHAQTGGKMGATAVERAAECSDLRLVPEDQHPRYRALATQGVLKLCEPA